MSDHLAEPEDLNPLIEQPWFRRRGHYAQIVVLVQAAGGFATLYSNGAIFGVQTRLPTFETVVWSNQGPWAFTLVREDGEAMTGTSGLPENASIEEVAGLISEWPYQDLL